MYEGSSYTLMYAVNVPGSNNISDINSSLLDTAACSRALKQGGFVPASKFSFEVIGQDRIHGFGDLRRLAMAWSSYCDS